MNRRAMLWLLGYGVCVLLWTSNGSAASTHAQSGSAYDLRWNVVAGGGVMFSTSGRYTLGSTIGQPDAVALSGGTYTLLGGFWGALAEPRQLYLPLIIR